MSNKNHLVENGFYNTSFSGTDMVAIMQIDGTETMNGTHVLGSLQTLSYSLHMERRPIRSIGNVNAKDYVMGPRTIAGSLVFAVFDRHFAYSLMNDIRTETKNYTFLADELPPFNITITFANEYGKRSKLTIYGVRLINEGQVMSINDIFTENTYQYVATDIDYMTNIEGDDGTDQLFPQREFPKHIAPPDGNGYGDIILEEDKPYNDNNQNEDNNNEEQEETYQLNYDLDYYNKSTEEGLKRQDRVSFILDPKPTVGGICIKSNNPDIIIPIKAGTTYPIYQDLEPGKYKAYYYHQNKIKSNTVEFIIEKNESSSSMKIECPIVTKIDLNYITVRLDQGQQGIRYRELVFPPATWQEESLGPVIDKTIIIRDLKPGTFYEIVAYRGVQDSETIKVKTTLTAVNDIFKTIVINNLEDSAILKGQKEIVKNFIIGADRYQSQNQGCSITESYMNAIVQNTKFTMNYPDIRYYLAHQASLLESMILERYIGIDPIKLKDSYSAELIMPDQTMSLTISGNRCPKQIVPKNRLIRTMDNKGDMIRVFTLLNNSPGVYSAYRIDDNNRYSCSLQVPVIDHSHTHAEQLKYKNFVQKKTSKQKQAFQDMLLIENSLTDYEKDLLSNQWSIQKNNSAEMLLHPEISQQNSRIVIKLNDEKRSVNHVLWLCICETDKVIDQNLITKIETSSSDNYKLDIDPYDYFIQPNKRYSVWYQDPQTLINYKANSFICGKNDEITNEVDNCLSKLEFDQLKKFLSLAVNKYACYHLRSYIESRIQICLESSSESIQTVLKELVQLISLENNLTKEDTCFAMLVILEIERLIVSSQIEDDFVKVLFDYENKKFGCNTYSEKDIYVIKGFIYKGECHYLSPESVDFNWQTDLSFCPIGSIAFLYLFQYGTNRVLSPIVIDASNEIKVFGQSVGGHYDYQ